MWDENLPLQPHFYSFYNANNASLRYIGCFFVRLATGAFGIPTTHAVGYVEETDGNSWTWTSLAGKDDIVNTDNVWFKILYFDEDV